MSNEPEETIRANSAPAKTIVPPAPRLPRPKRSMADIRADVRPVAALACAIGALALALVIAGTLVQVWAGGLGTPEEISNTLTSNALMATAVAGAIAGALAGVLALATYRRFDTAVARSLATAGGVFGAQALLLGLALAVFLTGDVETFSANFLNFEDVTPQLPDFFNGMLNTIWLAFAAGMGGMSLGLLVALFAVSRRAIVRAPARVYVNVVRGTPILLQISLIFFGVSLGLGVSLTPAAAIIVALAVNAAAYYAEIFRAGLQSIERGQLEAAHGLGLSYLKTLRLVIVPQAVRRVIPPLLSEFIAIVKDTSLIGFLGVTLSQRELFSVAQQGYAQSFNATFFVFSALGYLAITLPLIALVNVVERRLRSGLAVIA